MKVPHGPLNSEYNRSVYTCLECNFSVLGTMSRHIYSFCNAPIGYVLQWECPQCFSKWHCHAGNDYVDLFLDAVSEGKNLHHKSNTST